ncbi:MAG TPA: hypothetical protein VI541_00640 [Actinomycetota bacterium]|nr:hypothetical protein [Actinomycetota bacterium]
MKRRIAPLALAAMVSTVVVSGAFADPPGGEPTLHTQGAGNAGDGSIYVTSGGVYLESNTEAGLQSTAGFHADDPNTSEDEYHAWDADESLDPSLIPALRRKIEKVLER